MFTGEGLDSMFVFRMQMNCNRNYSKAPTWSSHCDPLLLPTASIGKRERISETVNFGKTILAELWVPGSEPDNFHNI
jgi:hypothetical protein